MGFPLGYSELFLPKLLLQILFLLGFIRRIISYIFTFLGLGDLLDSDSTFSDAPHSATHTQHPLHSYSPPPQSFSAKLIKETLPVVKFQHLPHSISDSCAVCLYEFESDDEVRRLSNCRHVFHRFCLDGWMEHEQSTCPLCRTALVPDEMKDEFNDRIWAAAAASYSNEFDAYYNSFLISA